MKIAFETYGDLYQWRKIFDLNRGTLSSPTVLPVGTVLKIDQPIGSPNISRNGERYLIRNGDTLGSISQSVYGTPRKWKKIWQNNREMIRDPNKIYAGFHLYYQFTGQDEQEKNQLDSSPKPLAGQGEQRNPSGQ